jgi:hypothetical protein
MASLDSDGAGAASGANAMAGAQSGGLDGIFAELTPVRQGSGASGMSHSSARRAPR